MSQSLSLPVLLPIFLVAAAVVWVASTHLSTSSDLLADRWHLGQALAGLLLIAIVEDLPEVVIVVSGVLAHHFDLITGNLLGGIATQTVILVAVDAIGVADHPLSYRAASLVMVLEGLQGLVVFSLVLLATQLPASLIGLRLTPGSVLIFVAWLLTTWLIKQAPTRLPWEEKPQTPLPPAITQVQAKQKAKQHRTSTRHAALVFAASALAILVAGYALEESSSVLAGDVGLSGVVFGGTILALATALPEFSTGYTTAKCGSFALAVSEVFGSNTFLPVLFLPATLLAGQAILPNAKAAEIYLTGLGMLLTTVYLWGLIFRPARQYLRLGPDSIVVLVVYAIGVAGLVAIAGGG
jgi:cation:H+ antiporter